MVLNSSGKIMLVQAAKCCSTVCFRAVAVNRQRGQKPLFRCRDRATAQQGIALLTQSNVALFKLQQNLQIGAATGADRRVIETATSANRAVHLPLST